MEDSGSDVDGGFFRGEGKPFVASPGTHGNKNADSVDHGQHFANSSTWGLINSYNQLADKIYQDGDPRSRDWFLAGRMDAMVGITICYLFIVWIGPRLMKNRPAFDLSSIMLVYNILLVGLSLWMFLELFINSRISGYNYFCDPYTVSSVPSELRIVRAMWVYYLSKAIEFLDTIFMILKKKQEQVTVLHVYHHTVMFPMFYLVLMYGPCCQALFCAMMNSLVHVFMYAYYALAVFPRLRPYLWWKKYITQFQLTQFALILTATCTGLALGCNYPPWLAKIQVVFVSSLVVLFLNFYLRSYILRKQRRADTRVSTKKAD